MIYDTGNEFLYFIAQACAIPFVEELLVVVLVFVAKFEVVGLPPWAGDIGIALGA